MKVAYARVMLVGPGGVGKSSLPHGLMNLPLPAEACSTQLADTFTLRPTDTYWARSKCGGHWVKVTDKDEIDELVKLIQARNKSIKNAYRVGNYPYENRQFSHAEVKNVVEEVIEATTSADSGTMKDSMTLDTYLRVWDCGGQPVFLDILPAFLTARTLFLLMFDARYDLRSPCVHLSHSKGEVSKYIDETTTLELMIQWMASIHASLLRKKPLLNSEDVHEFPLILPVGTHGDLVKASVKDIFDPLTSETANKAFSHLLLDGVIVDNTTAGKREFEDVNFQKIREIATKFATENLAVRTPIRWVLFQKTFERSCRKKPVVSLEEVKELGRACSISEDVLPSVLAFYHDLAVFLHYSTIPSLQSCVIADPQWLIRQMAKLLALEGYEIVRKESLWRLLREDGILVEPLYNEVLRTQNELDPQQIIDLLEHFLIIARIYTTKQHKCPGKEYFVPSMLSSHSSRNVHSSKISAIQSAVPLHLTFSTNYLPPGFFTRLVTVLCSDAKCNVNFSTKLYRNAVSLNYGHHGGQVDLLSVKETKVSVCIQVQRVAPRTHKGLTFIRSCHEIFQLIKKSSSKVLKWLPGIDYGFALTCTKCPDSNHFIDLPSQPSNDSNPFLFCQHNVPTHLTSDQKLWLSIHQSKKSVSGFSGCEIDAIASEVQAQQKSKDLAKALEMPESEDIRTLLNRWLKEMAHLGTPARPDLMFHLSSMGMQELHDKMLYEEITPEQQATDQECSVESLQDKPLQTIPRYKLIMEAQQRQISVLKQHVEHLTKSHGSTQTLFFDSDKYEVPIFMRLFEQHLSQIREILHPYSHKWKAIGEGLSFTHDELSNIEATPTLFFEAPASYLSTLLARWMQWAPKDARGSKDYATLYSLCTAVKKAGLGRVAEQLQSISSSLYSNFLPPSCISPTLNTLSLSANPSRLDEPPLLVSGKTDRSNMDVLAARTANDAAEHGTSHFPGSITSLSLSAVTPANLYQPGSYNQIAATPAPVATCQHNPHEQQARWFPKMNFRPGAVPPRPNEVPLFVPVGTARPHQDVVAATTAADYATKFYQPGSYYPMAAITTQVPTSQHNQHEPRAIQSSAMNFRPGDVPSYLHGIPQLDSVRPWSPGMNIQPGAGFSRGVPLFAPGGTAMSDRDVLTHNTAESGTPHLLGDIILPPLSTDTAAKQPGPHNSMASSPTQVPTCQHTTHGLQAPWSPEMNFQLGPSNLHYPPQVSNQSCRLFNEGRCKKVSCRYQHTCSTCQSLHPAVYCPRRHSNSRSRSPHI